MKQSTGVVRTSRECHLEVCCRFSVRWTQKSSRGQSSYIQKRAILNTPICYLGLRRVDPIGRRVFCDRPFMIHDGLYSYFFVLMQRNLLGRKGNTNLYFLKLGVFMISVKNKDDFKKILSWLATNVPQSSSRELIMKERGVWLLSSA